jgi:hypothetical protein
MNPLNESAWKSIAAKNKIKDNGLLRALADYDGTDEDDHAARLAGIAKVNKLAAALQKDKAVAENDAAVDYLDDVQDAASAEQKAIANAKVTADKAEALAKKKEMEEDKLDAKLGAALQKIKGGASFEFLACEGPERCAVILAPAIQVQQRQQLMRLTGGKRFYGPGSCRYENGKYVFGMERPASGLAKKLQAAILADTGRRIALLVGAESEDGEA